MRTETEEIRDNLKYLSLLARDYPSQAAAASEIISTQALLKLPKGTEHFMSDLHGENEAFVHILNSASGVIREKVDIVLGDTVPEGTRAELATLIYYPNEKLPQLKERCADEEALEQWYSETLLRLIDICRLVSSKHTREHVRACLPSSCGYILDELLHAHFEDHNINLVTPGQWRPWIIAALDIARAEGLRLPIVCNTGGYETVESVEAWRGYIDIWLADLKYVSSSLSAELSSAPDYFAQARPAIEAMMAQAGHPVFDSEGILQKGVILRHLALPGHIDDSFAVLDQMAAWNEADPGCFIPSVMSQYTPFYKAAEHDIGRRITTYEYRRVVNYAMDLGLTDGYMQQKSSAREEYTPSFDLTGI